MAELLKNKVVALYDDVEQARQAVYDLLGVGFTRDEIDLIAYVSSGEAATYIDPEGRYNPHQTRLDPNSEAEMAAGAGIGAALGGLGGLLLGMALLPIPGIGPIVVAGPLVAALAGVVGGGVVGGLFGALAESGLPEQDAHYYAEGVRRGGSLVIVQADNSSVLQTGEHALHSQTRLEQATAILQSHDPVNVEERVDDWRQRGWQRHDPSAPHYSEEQIAAERELRTR
jgi:hypothetical protein